MLVHKSGRGHGHFQFIVFLIVYATKEWSILYENENVNFMLQLRMGNQRVAKKSGRDHHNPVAIWVELWISCFTYIEAFLQTLFQRFGLIHTLVIDHFKFPKYGHLLQCSRCERFVA